MTNEEAVEILKHEHDYAQLLSYVNEALKTAVSALEKQTPKKPIVITKGDLIGGYCPSCGARTSYGDLSWHKVFNKYCHKCGQAIDWSDTE